MPIPVLYGLLLGLSQFLATLLVFAFGLHSSAEGLVRAQKPESILGFVLMMVVLGLAYRAAKKAALARGDTDIAFGTAAKLASLIAVVGGLVAGVTQWIYRTWINTVPWEIMRTTALKNAQPHLAQLSAEAAASETQVIEFFNSPLFWGMVYAINTLLFASLLGIAYALIFRAAAKREAAAKTPKV